MLCGDLDKWDEGVGCRSKRERIYVYIDLIHFIVQQELIQYKATRPQITKKITSNSLAILDFFFYFLFHSLLCDLLSLVLCWDSFFFFVHMSIIDFWFHDFWFSSLYVCDCFNLLIS